MGGGGSQTTVSSSGPWKDQKPYIKEGFEEAKDLYDKGGQHYYSGNTVAGFSPDQEQAFGLAKGRALNGNATMNAAEGYTQDVLGGKYSGDPYQSQVFNSIASNVMPAVNSQFSAGGRYGSGAHAGTMTEELTNAFAPYASQQYENSMSRMGQAANAAQGFAANDYADISALSDIGGQRRELAQSEIQDAKNRFDYEQDLPANQLAQYMGFIGGNYGSQGTSTQNYSGGSGLGGLLGGALGVGSKFF